MIKERSGDIEPSIKINAALALDHALLRRGLAAELGGVISFEGHEASTPIPQRALRRDPRPKVRQDVAGADQIAKAGVWIFKELARETREGIRPTSGILPLEGDGRRPGMSRAT